MVTKTCKSPVLLLFFLSVFSQLGVIEPNPLSLPKPWKVPACPKGWKLTPKPRSCVSDLDLNTKFSWEEARDECRKHDADLLTVSNTETKNFILQHTREQLYMSVWLALTSQEDGWVWNLGDTTRIASFTSWAPGHPIHSRLKTCAIQQKFDQGWKSVSCREKHSVICETQTIINSHKICKTGIKILWVGSVKCVTLVKEKLTWEAAKEKCKEMDGFLLTIFAKQVAQRIDGYSTRPLHRWIGLHRSKKNGQWAWANGLEMSFRNWGAGKPSNRANNSCAYQAPHGTWIDTSCKKTFFPLCQKKVRDFTKAFCSKPSDKHSPKVCENPGSAEDRNTQLNIKYHRPGLAVVRDKLLEMTCTADDTKGRLSWITFKSSGPEVLSDEKATTKFELVEDEYGLPVNRTISTLVINATLGLQGAEISCFTMPHDKPRKCRKLTPCDTSCCVSPPLKLWGKPLERPLLDISSDGARGSGGITEDSVVYAVCLATVDEAGDITWVIYYPKGPTIISNNDNSHVVQYKRFLNTRSDIKRVNIKSRLQLRLYKYLSGTSIACFSYDLGGPESDLDCSSKNPFCKRSPELIAYSSYEETVVPVHFLPLQAAKEDGEGGVSSAVVALAVVLGVVILLLPVALVIHGQATGQDIRIEDLWNLPSPDDSAKKKKHTVV